MYFKEAWDGEHPLRFQYGRMTLDQVDRRLVARNVWRNTTNRFQGFRGILGQRTSDWEAARSLVRKSTFVSNMP